MKPVSICETPPCPSAPLKRPRYFPRQLITPAEMNLEQAYFRDRLRLHNRMMHGWGTVCGALVCPLLDADNNPVPWCVVVKPGYLLGPCGDEIYIDREQKVDLRKACVVGAAGEPHLDGGTDQHRDPWCSEIFVKREAGPLYVAVRYREILARPVPVQPVGCGCDDAACEYSRWCDGYEICALPECPESHQDSPGLDDLFEGPIPDCPECPDSPWVVLARVDVDADGNIQAIDNCVCRRMVISFGNARWQCQGEAPPPPPPPPPPPTTIARIEVTDGRVSPGETFAMRVLGEHFPIDGSLSLGSGLSVVESHIDPGEAQAKVEVATNARPGKRKVAIVAADGAVLASERYGLTIVRGGR